MPSDPIRVVLADDHPIVRGGLVALFETLDGISVVAQAHDSESAIRETALQLPDVLVLRQSRAHR